MRASKTKALFKSTRFATDWTMEMVPDKYTFPINLLVNRQDIGVMIWLPCDIRTPKRKAMPCRDAKLLFSFLNNQLPKDINKILREKPLERDPNILACGKYEPPTLEQREELAEALIRAFNPISRADIECWMITAPRYSGHGGITVSGKERRRKYSDMYERIINEDGTIRFRVREDMPLLDDTVCVYYTFQYLHNKRYKLKESQLKALKPWPRDQSQTTMADLPDDLFSNAFWPIMVKTVIETSTPSQIPRDIIRMSWVCQSWRIRLLRSRTTRTIIGQATGDIPGWEQEGIEDTCPLCSQPCPRNKKCGYTTVQFVAGVPYPVHNKCRTFGHTATRIQGAPNSFLTLGELLLLGSSNHLTYNIANHFAYDSFA